MTTRVRIAIALAVLLAVGVTVAAIVQTTGGDDEAGPGTADGDTTPTPAAGPAEVPVPDAGETVEVDLLPDGPPDEPEDASDAASVRLWTVNEEAIVTELSPGLSGVTEADAGVESVSVDLVNISLGRSWAQEPFEAVLDDPGATETAWRVPAEDLYTDREDLWRGQYAVVTTTVDTSGAETTMISSFWAERTKPIVAISWPVNNELVREPEIVITGSARDDVQLAAIDIAMVDENGNWLQSDGTFRGRRADLPIARADLGGAGTLFEQAVDLPTTGRYTLFITARDWNDNESVRRRTIDYEPDRPAGDPGKATVILSRSLWGVPERCTEPVELREEAITLVEVADALAEREIQATSSVTPDRHNELTPWCHSFATTTASWSTLNQLRDQYGWSVISHGQTYTPLTDLSTEEQQAESCGSLEALADRGFADAWALFAYPNNRWTEEIHESVVSACFAFGRNYKVEYNDLADLQPGGLLSVVSVSGGHCNDDRARCFDTNLMVAGRRYVPPSELEHLLDVPDGHWTILQFYRFVTGQKLDGFERWDCTAQDPNLHWTNSGELYCWEDFLQVMYSAQDIEFTDAASVARELDLVPAGVDG